LRHKSCFGGASMRIQFKLVARALRDVVRMSLAGKKRALQM